MEAKLLLKVTTLIRLFSIVTSAAALPPPPSVESMVEWLSYSKPVTLVGKEIEEPDTKIGNPIWIASYAAKTQSLVSFTVAVYERGTYLKENRARMERLILQTATKRGDNEMIQDEVQTRPDGRKVFFFMSGFGAGGDTQEGFTSLPNCDLVVTQQSDYEHNEPVDHWIKYPAFPRNKLPVVFQKVEEYLLNTK